MFDLDEVQVKILTEILDDDGAAAATAIWQNVEKKNLRLVNIESDPALLVLNVNDPGAGIRDDDPEAGARIIEKMCQGVWVRDANLKNTLAPPVVSVGADQEVKKKQEVMM